MHTIDFGNPYLHQRGATLLVSREGIGKSTLVREWAAALTRGEAWPSGELLPSPIGVSWCGEEHEEYWRYRMEQAGADMSLCRYTPISEVGDCDDGPQIVYSLAQHGGLVVVDPLMAVCGDIDDKSYSKMRRAVSAWLPMADKWQWYRDAGARGICRAVHPRCALVLIHHANREARRDTVSNYHGSVGLGGVVDVILDLVAPADASDTRRDLVVGKSRDDRTCRRGDRLALHYVAGLYVERTDQAPIAPQRPQTAKTPVRTTDSTDYAAMARDGRDKGLSLNATLAANKIAKGTTRYRRLRAAWRALQPVQPTA